MNEHHWHNSGLWDLVRKNDRLERVIHEPYAEELRHSQTLLARCGWGDAPEDHPNGMAAAVGVQGDRTPVYSIAVQDD